MSVRETRGGRWEVRWRDGERHLSRTFSAKIDADRFDIDRRRQSQLGVHGTPDASATRLGEWLRQWWDLEAPGWRRSTRTCWRSTIPHRCRDMRSISFSIACFISAAPSVGIICAARCTAS
jgi:hypothetical protein